MTARPRRRRSHRPLGPGGTWKTGQRVQQDGHYADQFNVITTHYEGDTFPPCVGRKGEGANRRLVQAIRRAI